MRRREMKKSNFLFNFMLLLVGVWLFAAFFIADNVRVTDFYQGRLEDVLEQAAQNDNDEKSYLAVVRSYQNDIATPVSGDEVTAIRFLAESDFIFYKGNLSQAELVDAKRQENRKICNVFMGIFFGILGIMYLITRVEEKTRRKIPVVDAH